MHRRIRIRLTKWRFVICYLQIAISESSHETWRQTPLPPRRGRFAPRPGPFDDPAGTGHGHEKRDRARFKPGVSLADRERSPAPSDTHNTRAAGAILPRLSRLPGGRPGGLYAGASV